jgi:hypothetical protein
MDAERDHISQIRQERTEMGGDTGVYTMALLAYDQHGMVSSSANTSARLLMYKHELNIACGAD